MRLKRTLAITLLAGATATAGYFDIGTNAGAAGGASIGPWGFDVAGMDTSIKPGDDFFRHVGGTWMKNTPIPADRSRWGSFNMLAAKSEEDVRNLVEAVARGSNRTGSIEQKVADYYNSYLDTSKIDQLGLAPFEADLAEIAGLKTHEDFARLIGQPGMPA
ncbi:MAG: peptidase M13, partial [Alphaproteobacteria bacterium]